LNICDPWVNRQCFNVELCCVFSLVDCNIVLEKMGNSQGSQSHGPLNICDPCKAMLDPPENQTTQDAPRTNPATNGTNGFGRGNSASSPRNSAPQKSVLRNGAGAPQDVRDNPSGTVEVSDGRHFIRYIGGIHAGDTYDGNFRNGVKHGYGTYRWASGDTYTGEYCDDLKHGRGMYSWANGRQCVAEYAQGKRLRTIVESEWRDGMWVLPPIPDNEQRHR